MNCLTESWYMSDNENKDLSLFRKLMILITIRVQCKDRWSNFAHLAVDNW